MQYRQNHLMINDQSLSGQHCVVCVICIMYCMLLKGCNHYFMTGEMRTFLCDLVNLFGLIKWLEN